jgi:hypothetical protein
VNVNRRSVTIPVVLAAVLALPLIAADKTPVPPAPKEAAICPEAGKPNATREQKECWSLLKLQALQAKQQSIIDQANAALKPIADEIMGVMKPLCDGAGIPVADCRPDLAKGVISGVASPPVPDKPPASAK